MSEENYVLWLPEDIDLFEDILNDTDEGGGGSVKSLTDVVALRLDICMKWRDIFREKTNKTMIYKMQSNLLPSFHSEYIRRYE